jgi:hypothetical protein
VANFFNQESSFWPGLPQFLKRTFAVPVKTNYVDLFTKTNYVDLFTKTNYVDLFTKTNYVDLFT